MEILNLENNQIQGDWIKCKKVSYVIEACKVAENMKIYSPLECSEVFVQKGEILMRGLLGEPWVIGKEKFLSRYTSVEGESLNSLMTKESFDWIKVATKASDDVYFALRIPKTKECGIYGMKTDNKDEALYFNENGEMFRTVFAINSKNSISNHGNGDCLMCMSINGETPDYSDIWVVDGFLFDKTYKVL